MGEDVMDKLRCGWLAAALLLGGASCSASASDVCNAWAEDTCKAVGECCGDGTVIDSSACTANLFEHCRDAIRMTWADAPLISFDSGAAKDCLGSLSSCSDAIGPRGETFEHRKACANMITGSRYIGSSCNFDAECEHAGEYSVCQIRDGVFDGDRGICKRVVIDERRCSESFSVAEIRVCPDEKFCDRNGKDPGPDDGQLGETFLFGAPCRDRIAEGKSCIDPRNDTDLLTCQVGLYCKLVSGNEATCEKPKPPGATCDFVSGVDACAPGSFCTSNPAGEKTCQRVSGMLCTGTTSCGNGICELGEEQDGCSADCKGDFFCGDGLCDPSENASVCPNDCPER
ncbi:Hypothetical protein A7982_00963 [Minicystis rosea]|nr:Hypothetical protein A7982_00963 [Minicystis rosea]